MEVAALRRSFVSALFALVLLPMAGHAGTRCDAGDVPPAKVAAAAETAMRVVAELDRAEAPVARVGTDLSKQGLVYSHVGFALRDHADERWTVLHLLNECGTDRSSLHAQGW